MTLPSTTLISAIPIGPEVTVIDGNAPWRFYRFEDGAILAEDPGNCRVGAMLPPTVAQHCESAADAIRVVVLASDRYRLIGQIAMALDHGAVLSGAVYPAPVKQGHPTHATVGKHPDGRGGYGCVTDPCGAYVVARIEEDRGPFAAARGFVDTVGPASAAGALVVARQRAVDASAAIDATRAALLWTMRERAAQRCPGRPEVMFRGDNSAVVVECPGCAARLVLPLRPLNTPEETDIAAGQLRSTFTNAAMRRWVYRYGTGQRVQHAPAVATVETT